MINVRLIQMPNFKPNYRKNSYGYTGIKGDNLKILLRQTSNDYCMYCYCKINIDSKFSGHMEHSIEQSQDSWLEECPLNIAIACPKCNLSFKKTNYFKEIFTKKQLENYSSKYCIQKECKKECNEYKILKRRYLKKRNIILQPNGIKIRGKEYKIQYNLLKLKFEPSELHNYQSEEQKVINKHINQFNLNDNRYRTKELVLFCHDVINGDKHYRKGKYSNCIVDLFIDQIENLTEEKQLQLCTTIYTIGHIKRLI